MDLMITIAAIGEHGPLGRPVAEQVDLAEPCRPYAGGTPSNRVEERLMTRLGVSVREAAWLLTLTETRVRRLAKRGTLRYAIPPTRISVESLRALSPQDELLPLREAALVAVLSGRARVPAAPSPDARPAPITTFAAYLTTTDTGEQPARNVRSCRNNDR